MKVYPLSLLAILVANLSPSLHVFASEIDESSSKSGNRTLRGYRGSNHRQVEESGGHEMRMFPQVPTEDTTGPSPSSKRIQKCLARAVARESGGNDDQRRVIIKYKDGKSKRLRAKMQKIDSEREQKSKPLHKLNLDFPDQNSIVMTLSNDEKEAYESDPDVEYVVDDEIRYATRVLEQGRDTQDHRTLSQSKPYGIDMVQASQVWDSGVTGAGCTVCVIDSGIAWGHEDFESTHLTGQSNANFPWYEDTCGHGTHVAGTIAASNNNEGVVGVAPDANLFVARVFREDCGVIWTLSSMIYAAALNCRDKGAKVINMSLGGGLYLPWEDFAFGWLYNHDNVLSVAAAGNDGDNRYSFPASYSHVMSVGAVDSGKNHAWFSNSNSQVDIAAPGVDVMSTVPGNKYDWYSGTSMATPHVAGVAALLFSAKPNATAKEVRAAIENTAIDLGPPGKDFSFGHGIVQAKEALDYLMA